MPDVLFQPLRGVSLTAPVWGATRCLGRLWLSRVPWRRGTQNMFFPCGRPSQKKNVPCTRSSPVYCGAGNTRTNREHMVRRWARCVKLVG